MTRYGELFAHVLLAYRRQFKKWDDDGLSSAFLWSKGEGELFDYSRSSSGGFSLSDSRLDEVVTLPSNTRSVNKQGTYFFFPPLLILVMGEKKRRWRRGIFDDDTAALPTACRLIGERERLLGYFLPCYFFYCCPRDHISIHTHTYMKTASFPLIIDTRGGN